MLCFEAWHQITKVKGQNKVRIWIYLSVMDESKDEELRYFILRRKTGIQWQEGWSEGINVFRGRFVAHIKGDRAGICRLPT